MDSVGSAQASSSLNSSTYQCNVEEADSSNIPSKRARFLVTYRRQSFSLPDSIMYYISKNPSTSECYEKMVQTCKYFFIKNSILVKERLLLEYKNDEWCTYLNGKYIKVNNLSSTFWVTDEIRIRNYVNPEHSIITSVVPKFYQCDANNLHLCKQNILFSDLQFFASSCKSIYLKMSTVINDDGTVVPLENLVKAFSNITYFCYDIAPDGRNAVTSKTVKKLLDIPHFQNLNYLDLLKIPEAFDIDTFYEYIKTNKKTDIYLTFCDQISEAYKARLQTIADEILATKNRDFKPPYISFSGHDEVSSDELYNLYMRR